VKEKAMWKLLVGIVFVGILHTSEASSQYMFLDTNGDGEKTDADNFDAANASALEVWLVTDRNRDGSDAVASSPEGALSVFSYEFILRAEGGTVQWGDYVNLQTTMQVPFGEHRSETDFYTGFGGTAPLPPGKHKLGTLTFRVKSGSPSVRFAASSELGGVLQTSFGSRNPGREGDNTVRFGPDRESLLRSGLKADWTDADGVQPAAIDTRAAAVPEASAPLKFAVEVVRDANMRPTGFRVSTTRPGEIQIALYNVHGRLVRRLGDSALRNAGVHFVSISPKGTQASLASGVYFYKVKTLERATRGKIALVK
jgi:hypothetical protein